MKTGLFSVSYAGLWGQDRLGTVEFIRKAGALGFDSVLLMAKRPHLSVLDADAASLASVRKAMAEAGVDLVGLACYNDVLLKGPAEVPIAEMQLAYIRRCCDVAAELGGGLVRIFTGYVQPGDAYGDCWRRTADFLREAGLGAAEAGVTLAVQNHHDLAVDTRSMALLLDEVGLPNVRAGYDAWSPFLRGEDLAAGARLMAPRTALTIAANYRRLSRYSYRSELVNYRREEPDFVRAVSMEEGEIDYGPFLAELKKGGFDGPVVYEMCSPLAGGGGIENLDGKARSFLAYVRDKV